MVRDFRARRRRSGWVRTTWFAQLSSLCTLALIAILCVTPLWAQTAAEPESAKQTGKNPILVQPEKAEQNLVKKIAPVYPALAKQAHLQGSVKLRLLISRTGVVASASVLSGHPLLVQAAIDAAKHWQYKPFIVDGQPAEVETQIEVPFSLGIPEADYKKEQQAADDYFKQEDNCRGLVQQKQYTEAESSCRAAVELVEKLPPERENERRLAYECLGHSLFFQKKFGDALNLYQQELAVAQRSLEPYEAELAYAYRDVAHGLHMTGDLPQARSDYERAISILEQARDHIDSDFLKNEYSGTIKTVLQEDAVLLRQLGDNSGAEVAEQKAQSIVVRTDLKN